jgi:hypothetical protein
MLTGGRGGGGGDGGGGDGGGTGAVPRGPEAPAHAPEADDSPRAKLLVRAHTICQKITCTIKS